MYYSELFTPLLSYAAHVRHGHRNPSVVARDVLRMTVDALEKARQQPAHVDEAWFPVCLFLDEALAPVWRAVGHAQPLRKRYFHDKMADWEFYPRLEWILSKSIDSGVRRDIAALYFSCLALGYQGNAGKKQREYHLRQCGSRLAARYAHSPQPARPRRHGMATAGNVLAWTVPLASTIALFCLCKSVLAELFAQVAG